MIGKSERMATGERGSSRLFFFFRVIPWNGPGLHPDSIRPRLPGGHHGIELIGHFLSKVVQFGSIGVHIIELPLAGLVSAIHRYNFPLTVPKSEITMVLKSDGALSGKGVSSKSWN